MSLSPSHIDALRELEDVWPDAEIVVIGAAALGFYYDTLWRRTADVDLVLTLEIDEFPGALHSRHGWVQHAKKQHEFRSPQGAKIDLLPAGPKLLEAGVINWPNGHVMSLAGMDLVFDHAESHNVSGRHVLVAPPPVVCMLKMTSYCDRPLERERDLEDIAHLLAAYVDDDSDRRFDEAVGHDFELAPAYLLGCDIGRITRRAAHKVLVDRFLARVADPDAVDHAVMQNRGPSHWRNADSLAHSLDAFRKGLAKG